MDALTYMAIAHAAQALGIILWVILNSEFVHKYEFNKNNELKQYKLKLKFKDLFELHTI